MAVAACPDATADRPAAKANTPEALSVGLYAVEYWPLAPVPAAMLGAVVGPVGSGVGGFVVRGVGAGVPADDGATVAAGDEGAAVVCAVGVSEGARAL